MSESPQGPILAPEEISALLAEMAPEEEAQALFATLPPMLQPAQIEDISFEQMKSDGPEKYEPFVKLHERMSQHLMDRWLVPYFKDAVVSLQGIEAEHLAAVLDGERDQLFLVYDCIPQGRLLMTIDKVLIVALVNVMLGGKGDISYEAPGTLSPVELRLAQRIATKLAVPVARSWERVPTFALTLKSIEPSSQKMLAALKLEECTTAKFQLQLNDRFEGALHIHYLPSFTVPVLEMMRSSSAEEEAEPDQVWQQQLLETLESVPATLKLELGCCWLNVNDFLHLKEGDFLPLKVRETDPVKLYVESVPMFWALPGQQDGMVAAEIMGTISEVGHE